MKKTPPRLVPGWDEFYMGMAFMHASRSKDPSTQHGAVIIDKNNLPRGWGYNGTPKRIQDREIDWSRPAKYPFIRHAEKNAIRRCGVSDISQGTIYITGFPCKSCALDIVDTDIKRIVYGPQSSVMVDEQEIEVVKEICRLGSLTLDKYIGSLNWLFDRLNSLKTNLPEAF